MSRLQRIQWVVLPAGVSPDGTSARISVFVAPRLGADQEVTLADFPDFLDWPARLATAQFFVDVTDRDGTPTDTEIGPLDRIGPPPESALWKRFFARETLVVPFEFDDFRSTVKVSYPAKRLADDTRVAFAGAAAQFPDELPTATDMSQTMGFAAPGDMTSRLQSIAGALADADQLALADPDGPAQPELSPQDAFLAFHQRELPFTELTGGSAVRSDPPPRPTTPVIDFHQMLSSLGDHPALLRRLGLVVDLSVPVEQLKPTRGTLGLALSPRFASLLPDAATEDLTPATRYVLVPGEEFCAASAGSDPLGPPARGLMALPESQYSLEQADIDGVNLKLIAAAGASQVPGDVSPNFPQNVSPNGPQDVSPDGTRAEPTTPPSVRTTGLALVRGGRAQSLQEDFRHAAAQQQSVTDGSPAPLTAEDLVRGHRIDVFDESRQRWFSLHERVVDYHSPGVAEPLGTVTDEGFLQVSLAQPEGPVPRIHVHEHVVSWDGWALSAPRPGKALVEAGADDNEGAGAAAGPRRIANRAATTMPLEIEAQTRPGSLPRLRFGRSYRLRVRTVDLAGNGPTLEDAERLMDQDVLLLPNTGGEVFRRYEAVPAPVLLPRAPLAEGESAHRMVIRSTKEQSPQEYADQFNAAPPVSGGAHQPPYRPADERHLVAPKSSVECVERHGLFDAAIASADPQARRAAYDLAVRESGRLDDPGLDGVTVVDLPASGDGPPQQYVVHTGERIELPYLPDPLSLGVVFHGLSGNPEDRLEVPWDGPAWHAPRSLRLRLVEGTAPPQLDAAARVLTVSLPKAAVRTVRVSSKSAVVNEKILGMLHWCRDALGGDARFEQVMAAARAHRHWMLTPWHELTLVHAVQRPLNTPALTLFDIDSRVPGDTQEHLAGFVDLDPPSTQRIDLLAHWTERVDDLNEPGPRDEPLEMAAPVFQLPLALATPFDDGVDINNTPSTLTDTALFFSTAAAEAAAHDQGILPATPEAQQFGDTKHRLVRYEPVATSPFGDCFPPEFTEQPERDLLSLRGELVEHVVLSSAQPAAPQVLDCLPTLAFETSGSLPGPFTRLRRGGGLRLWLARPWFTSGDGELLAVLVTDEGMEPERGSDPFISVMGRDPMHRSAPVSFPTAQHFPGATDVRTSLVLPDPTAFFDGFTVTAVGYAPQFDEDSGLWFCDLDLDTGEAYFPFVRLALARYQPHSLEGQHLSPIVHTPVLRTLPKRLLTAEGTDPLTLTLSGPNYLTDSLVPEVIVSLQSRDPALEDEALAWTTAEGSELFLETEDSHSHVQTYTGQFPLPSPLPPGPLRLLVTEEALSGSDFAPSEDFGPLGRQLIYSDTVPL
ncbi:hypothetical protein ACFY12_35495 [Streptomyces sp. NPDC001339]|uniref:hypothetical protein n=1 Tax=Streptomyces sp. NPDC001339 TaxID=3364563 RepID=UPI0036C15C27